MNDSENQNTIHGIISAIKLVRCFTGLGLKDAKIVAERWTRAFGYAVSYVATSDYDEICSLGRLACGVKNGDFVINERGEIVIHRPITDADIRDL